MPRQQRYRLPGIPQHVIQRGNNRQPTFFKPSDYRKYLECLRICAEEHDCAVHAYVLMTNHVHLLMTPYKADGISRVIQSVGRRYVYHINKSYERTGTLWEGRYKASLIDSESYLLSCYRYVELNPVRAGLVKSPSDYVWSSYHCNALGEPADMLTPHACYTALGRTDRTRQQAYRAMFRDAMDVCLLREIRETAQQCRVLGSGAFIDHIKVALAIKAAPGKRGRPRKGINGSATKQ